jgi:hypothetical protein
MRTWEAGELTSPPIPIPAPQRDYWENTEVDNGDLLALPRTNS